MASPDFSPEPQVLECPLTPAENWSNLTRFVNRWFHAPDLEALRIAIASVASHYVVSSDPIWLFVVGPSSSGKTSMVINAIRDLPLVHIQSSLTPKTLMSSYRGDHSQSLLHRIGKSGILIFKDFTTFLSEKDENRKIISAQLREVYDGEFKSESGVGNSDGKALWEGKISLLGVCTTSLDRAWGFQREMGERFVQVRWPRIDGIEMSLRASEQRGEEKRIFEELAKLGAAFVSPKRLRPARPVENPWRTRIAALAELTARSRGHVDRDSFGDRPIINVPPPEQSPRLSKALELLVDTHAQLFDHPIGPQDFQTAVRVAFDSIPLVRSVIIRAAQVDGGIALADLSRLSRIAPSTLTWNLDELMALDIVTVTKDSLGQNNIELQDWTQELIDLANPVLPGMTFSRKSTRKQGGRTDGIYAPGMGEENTGDNL